MYYVEIEVMSMLINVSFSVRKGDSNSRHLHKKNAHNLYLFIIQQNLTIKYIDQAKTTIPDDICHYTKQVDAGVTMIGASP